MTWVPVLIAIFVGWCWLYQRATQRAAATTRAAAEAKLAEANEWINSVVDLPVVTSGGIAMQRGEVCHWSGECSWHELRTTTKRVNYSGPRASIRLAKGVSYSVGSLNLERVKETKLHLIDVGHLYITSKRLFFDGREKNTSITWKQVATMLIFDGGFEVEKQAGKSPLLTVSDWARTGALAVRAHAEWMQSEANR